MSLQKHTFFAIALYCLTLQNIQSNSIFTQLSPEVLKHVNVESPSREDQKLIDACQLSHKHGTELAEVNSELMQTIINVGMFSEVLPRIKRTATTFGYLALATQCATMTNDPEKLAHMLQRLQYFDNNPEEVKQLAYLCSQAAQREHVVLNQEAIKFAEKFQNASCLEEKISLAKNTDALARSSMYYWDDNWYLSFLNEQPINLEISKRLALLPVAAICAMPAGCAYGAYYLIRVFPDTSASLLAMSAVYTWIAYLTLDQQKKFFDTVYEQQKQLLDLHKLIKSIQKTAQFIENNASLAKILPEYTELKELFNPESEQTSANLKKLINFIQSSSFVGSPSYILSQQGKILATYHLLMRTQNELIPYMQAFGQIDAHLSTFKLYQEYKNHPNAHFCLVNFVDNDTPQVNAQEFWHPVIGADSVVTNNLALGKTYNRANLIITGPNAGGKTTSLMSLIINIIMAQSFGIAPSSALTITPFAKIHSYLDITTNLIEGESLFKAEINRAKALKESVNSCQPGQKAFTIIDEIFSGTAPDVASKVGFKFADQIGKVDHSMTIITTHFPRLTDLEEETNNYQNYKVADAHIAEDGTITYPFKLIPGKSTQNIAEHMLEHEDII